MVATTSQETIGNIMISASFVSFIFATFLATVVFDKPNACTDAYIPEIEMAMMANPIEQHIDVWVDAFLPMHTIVDIIKVKRVDRKTGKTKSGSLMDLFPSNGPATGLGTVVFKIELVDRKKIPIITNITKMVPAAYIKSSTFTSFKKGYLKMMALYIKYFKFLIILIVLAGLGQLGAGAFILWRMTLNKKRKTPVHAKVEITGDTYEDGRNGHSMIKTPTHDYPTPIHRFEIPKSYGADSNGHLMVNSYVPRHQTTPVHAFETPVHMRQINAGQINNTETPVVAFMETPTDNATVNVIVEPIPVETENDTTEEPVVATENDVEEAPAATEDGVEDNTTVETKVEETVTATVETLVHDLVDKIAPAATDNSVRASVKTMVHSMVEKLVHTLVESLNTTTTPTPLPAKSATPEPEPEPEPVAESPIESLEDALRDTPDVETESDIQIIEVAPAPEGPTNPDGE